MQFAKVFSAGIEGVDAFLVEVEVNRSEPRGQTGRTTIVGLPDAAVKESIERIVPAMFHSKVLHAGADNVVVNLAPAETRKEGPAFDLAIALAMGATIDENRLDGRLEGLLFFAELALDGRLRPARGVLSAALAPAQMVFGGLWSLQKMPPRPPLFQVSRFLPQRICRNFSPVCKRARLFHGEAS